MKNKTNQRQDENFLSLIVLYMYYFINYNLLCSLLNIAHPLYPFPLILLFQCLGYTFICFHLLNESIIHIPCLIFDLGLAMSLSELGATKNMIDDIVNGTFIMNGGYKVLTKDEIREIIKQSM